MKTTLLLHEAYTQVQTINCYLFFIIRKYFKSFLFLNRAHQKKNMTGAEIFILMLIWWLFENWFTLCKFIESFLPFTTEKMIYLGGWTRITCLKFCFFSSFCHRDDEFTLKKQEPHRWLKHPVNQWKKTYPKLKGEL